MSKMITVINDETIELIDVRNPNKVFNTNEYTDFENCVVFREIIKPFNMYTENEKLKYQLRQKENKEKEIREKIKGVRIYGLRSGKTLISTLLNDILEILDKEDKE